MYEVQLVHIANMYAVVTQHFLIYYIKVTQQLCSIETNLFSINSHAGIHWKPFHNIKFHLRSLGLIGM